MDMDRSAVLVEGVVIILVTIVASYCFARIIERIARSVKAVDHPTGGRKIHSVATPLWGGIAVALAIGGAVWALFPLLTAVDIRPIQLVGYMVGVLILSIGGAIDDRRPLPPRIQILFPTLAALAVIMTGTGIIQVTDPFRHGAYSLIWAQWDWSVLGTTLRLSLPSDLLTFAWILVATYAMKILDGLDGLVTGLTVIGASIVGALSLSIAYYQPSVALFSGIIGGAYLGFLPRNINPAKHFLGESGSTIAGFSLAFLAILSGAKIAVALAALAVPIADLGLVVAGRVKRGAPWFKGDATHLHHRLVQAGLSQRVAVGLYWLVALVAGIAALSLQTKGKLFVIVLLCAVACLASYIAGFKARRLK